MFTLLHSPGLNILKIQKIDCRIIQKQPMGKIFGGHSGEILPYLLAAQANKLICYSFMNTGRFLGQRQRTSLVLVVVAVVEIVVAGVQAFVLFAHFVSVYLLYLPE